jgi:hypothetical protein
MLRRGAKNVSEFEQMMSEINVPEEIAEQIAGNAPNGEVLEIWNELTEVVNEIFDDKPTAPCICALGMLVGFIGDKLSKNIVFGDSPEAKGENVHPNFCIMAIALLGVNSLQAAKALEEGHGDGKENEGNEKVEQKEGHKENGAANNGGESGGSGADA